MLERLVEYWLDSVNERSYQPAFVQMLVSEGHRVLHSTRHAPIELGKDVVTIAPDGIPCAFQLKGNPNGRLTHAQLREILPQIFELVTMAIAHPAAPNATHRSYLVTNGLIEEEVQLAISQLNRNWEQQGRPPNSLEVIDRGELLRRANALGPSMWPFDIQNLNAFVELLAHDGRDELPIDKINVMLSTMFELENPEPLDRPRILDRRATSTAILIAVSLRNFGIQQNHFALITAWVLYVTYTIAASERAGIALSETTKNSIEAARAAILNALSDLADEALGKQHWIEGAGIPDAPFYHARVALIAALMSVYWLWCDREGLTRTNIEEIQKFLWLTPSERCLWGEAAIPQILAHCWYIGKRRSGHAEQFSTAILSNILQLQLSPDNTSALASPYFPVSTVMRWRLGLEVGIEDGDVGNSDFRHSAHFAEALLSLAVRAGLKPQCQALWPSYTKLVHHSFEAERQWQFCQFISERGINHSVVPQHTGEWTELQATAAGIIIAPYRATPDVVRYLGWCFSDVWQLPEPRPTG